MLHSSQHDKEVKAQMLSIMKSVITESTKIHEKILEIVLESLLEKSQKMNPSAFELSKQLLMETAGALEQPIMMVF